MAGHVDCLAGFIAALGVESPQLVGLSFGGALALAVAARHPGLARSLVVVSGYAGWAGSLPPDVVDQRLTQALALSALTADEFVDALLPTMFSTMPTADDVDRFTASMRTFHPAGFRTIARASAEDLRGDLARIDVPTLLVYGDQDVRAPLAVAEHLHSTIAGSARHRLERHRLRAVVWLDFTDPDGMVSELNLVLDPNLAGGHPPIPYDMTRPT